MSEAAENHKRIWLQPICHIEERCWCEDPQPCDECGEQAIEYIRIDLVDELRAEIERLRAALDPFAEVARWAERNGYDLKKDFDMILRGPGATIAGHLQIQAADFLLARTALEPPTH